MRDRVFMCHASEDAGTAGAIVEALERRGIECWMAPRDVPLGAQYAQAIVAGISSAKALVLVFSDHANQSPHVAREAERAVSRGVPIFPVRASDGEPSAALEYFISSAQWLDITTGDLEEHVAQLAESLGGLMGAGEEPSARVAARDALHNAISRLGPGLADEPRRVEAILRDLAGEHKAEVAALSVAAAEGVGSALLAASAGMHEGLIEKLTQRLQNNRGLAAEVSRWAVETWGQVLGVAGHTAPPGAGVETVPVGEGPGPVGDEPLEAPSAPEPDVEPAPVEPLPDRIGAQVPDSIDVDEDEPPAEGHDDGAAEPTETVPAPAADAAETMAPTVAASQPPTVPLDPPPTTGPAEAMRLAGRAPRGGARWKVGAGVGAAVAAIAVVGVLATSGDPDGTSAAAGTTTTARVTTTADVTTTTGVTTTTTAANGIAAGTGTSDDPFRLPFVEEFGSFHNEIWDLLPEREVATWDIIGEVLTLEAREASLEIVSAAFDLPESFAASIVVSQSSLDGVECGLTIKASETSRLLFVVDAAEGTYDVLRDEDAHSGGWESLVPSWQSGTHRAIRDGEANRVELVVMGGELAFRLNGDTVLHLSGEDFAPPTNIGPVASMWTGGECRFDDFTVTEFEGPLAADVTTPMCPFKAEFCPALPYSQAFDTRVWVDPWGIESSDLGTYDWDIVDGQLSLDANRTGPDPEFFRARWTYFFGLPDSYVVSLDVAQTTGDGVSCGLDLAHHDDSFYRFDYLIDSANQEFSVWGPLSRVTYTREPIVPPTFDSAIRKGEVNRVELVVDGEELAFTANGETLAEWSQAFARLERIGPAARVEPGNAEECRFDNYSVVASN